VLAFAEWAGAVGAFRAFSVLVVSVPVLAVAMFSALASVAVVSVLVSSLFSTLAWALVSLVAVLAPTDAGAFGALVSAARTSSAARPGRRPVSSTALPCPLPGGASKALGLLPRRDLLLRGFVRDAGEFAAMDGA
jgi:hypothetical protein